VPLGIGRFGKRPSLEPDVLAVTAEMRRLGTNFSLVPMAEGVNCVGNMPVQSAYPCRTAGLKGQARSVSMARGARRTGDISFSGAAFGKDADDDQPARPASTLPNIYLDLRTNYATVPANTLSIGFSNPSLFTTLTTFANLTSLTNLTTLPAAQPCRRRQARASVSMFR
jgi:hypothetical protein